jgi:hypothetical protein
VDQKRPAKAFLRLVPDAARRVPAWRPGDPPINGLIEPKPPYRDFRIVKGGRHDAPDDPPPRND